MSTVRLTFHASLVALLSVTASACDDGSGNASTSTESASSESASSENAEPQVAVTEDGARIPIVFAGPHSDTRSQGAQSHDYDEDDLIREPNLPDPEHGDFTLEEAVAGLPVDGTLVAEIGTELGTLMCDLYADRAPRTVANFVGLARGARPWWDARAGEWVHRPYYRGLTFHRVIPEYLVQGGDYLGDGTGTIGYSIPDERDDSLVHDRAGQLCMANHDGANSAGAQFFLTDGPAPQLDAESGYTIFGQCQPQHIISEIARVPQNPDQGNRPLTPIHIARLLIRRVEGGAAAAQPMQARLPAGEPEQPVGASPGPFESRTGRPRSRDGRLYPEPSPMPRRGPFGPPIRPEPRPQN